MIVVLERGAKPDQVAAVVDELKRRGVEVQRIDVDGKPLLHVVAGHPGRARKVLDLEGVEGLVPTSGPRYRREGQRLFPHHVLRWCALAIVLLGALILLSGQMPPGIGVAIDVQHPPATLPVPWYARAPLAFVALFPTEQVWIGWLAFAVLVLAIVFVPRLDRGGSRAPWIGAGALLVLLALFAIVRGGAA